VIACKIFCVKSYELEGKGLVLYGVGERPFIGVYRPDTEDAHRKEYVKIRILPRILTKSRLQYVNDRGQPARTRGYIVRGSFLCLPDQGVTGRW
jgi:hypothetical protein